MIDFNTRMTENSLRVEPGDTINLSLDGTGGGRKSTVGRIRYTGDVATLYIGGEITIGGSDSTWTITSFGTNVDEDEVVLWVRPAG